MSTEVYLEEIAVRNTLKTVSFGRNHLEVHPELDSTNQRARLLALDGAEEGTLVLTDTQTSGRGRLGRGWHSPPGVNLYLSLVLRPRLKLETIPFLTLAAALAGAEALGNLTGHAPEIKWPNDLLLDRHKIAGILAEAEFRGTNVDFVILGMGLNVNLAASDLPSELEHKAGSLMIATGRPWDRVAVLADLLESLENVYDRLVREGAGGILPDYRRHCVTLGARVGFTHGGAVIEGRALDVNDSGELVVEKMDGGGLLTVNAGEVSLTSHQDYS